MIIEFIDKRKKSPTIFSFNQLNEEIFASNLVINEAYNNLAMNMLINEHYALVSEDGEPWYKKLINGFLALMRKIGEAIRNLMDKIRKFFAKKAPEIQKEIEEKRQTFNEYIKKNGDFTATFKAKDFVKVDNKEINHAIAAFKEFNDAGRSFAEEYARQLENYKNTKINNSDMITANDISAEEKFKFSSMKMEKTGNIREGIGIKLKKILGTKELVSKTGGKYNQKNDNVSRGDANEFLFGKEFSGKEISIEMNASRMNAYFDSTLSVLKAIEEATKICDSFTTDVIGKIMGTAKKNFTNSAVDKKNVSQLFSFVGKVMSDCYRFMSKDMLSKLNEVLNEKRSLLAKAASRQASDSMNKLGTKEDESEERL